jgi:hypothetical protein
LRWIVAVTAIKEQKAEITAKKKPDQSRDARYRNSGLVASLCRLFGFTVLTKNVVVVFLAVLIGLMAIIWQRLNG